MVIKINNKFIAYNGCIGRRDYILNSIYLGFVNMFLMSPMFYWQMRNYGSFEDMYNFKSIFASAPVFVTFFYALACLISIVIGSGLILRRFTDIAGERKPIFYLITAIMFLVPYIWLFYPKAIVALIYLLVLILSIVIMCIPGKISAQFPHDSIKRFNWGAFWGTWIWGLCNGVYITLWAIPLFFTPMFLYFAIICGMKGNEWAYKKKNTVDVEDFHKGQRHQAIGWNIFAGFMVFVLPILLVFLAIATMVTASIKDPEKFNNFLNGTESVMESYYGGQFEEYSLDVDENRFYINPKSWVNLDFNDRYNLLKGAASLASMKKRQGVDEKFENYSGSTYSEMEITKIYSSYNGEVLAEFNMDDVDVKDFKSGFKAALKAVKFNPNPTLPPEDEEN